MSIRHFYRKRNNSLLSKQPRAQHHFSTPTGRYFYSMYQKIFSVYMRWIIVAQFRVFTDKQGRIYNSVHRTCSKFNRFCSNNQRILT